MVDVITLGELLIDFTPVSTDSQSSHLQFAQHMGGAPANVAVAVTKYGKSSAFIGKVGNDHFGRFLCKSLSDNNINTYGLIMDSKVNTTLAFVHLDDKGERSFSFYRQEGADKFLCVEEIDFEMIRKASLFHFGSVSLSDEPSRSATLTAVNYAKQHKLFVSFDPNFRPLLWKNKDEAKKIILNSLRYVDLLKVSAEEMYFLTRTKDLDRATEFIIDEYNIKIILVTLGEQGCYFRFKSETERVPGFKVKTIDTTGAGDAFLGAFLSKFLDKWNDEGSIKSLSSKDIWEMVYFANGVGALTTQGKGAILSIPTKQELKTFFSKENKPYSDDVTN